MTDTHSRLDTELAALRQALGGANPPAATDLAIAAAIAGAKARAVSVAPQRRTLSARILRLAWPVLALGTAASLAAVIVLQSPADSGLPEALEGNPVPSSAAALRDGAQPFVPLVPIAEIERSGDTWIVPAQLSRVALAQYGMPIDPARAAEALDAELLLRPDGAVLAFRFTQ